MVFGGYVGAPFTTRRKPSCGKYFSKYLAPIEYAAAITVVVMAAIWLSKPWNPQRAISVMTKPATIGVVDRMMDRSVLFIGIFFLVIFGEFVYLFQKAVHFF